MNSSDLVHRQKQARVVGFAGNIGILIPIYKGWLNLITGHIWETPKRYSSHMTAGWVINPGDVCEMTSGDNGWWTCTYGGYSGDPQRPFNNDLDHNHTQIRPIKSAGEFVPNAENKAMHQVMQNVLKAQKKLNVLMDEFYTITGYKRMEN